MSLRYGQEPFHAGWRPLDFRLLDYWRWSGSDLLGNAERGVLAEFLVANALGVADRPRIEWASHDVKTKEGTRVEVKSAAYRQSWAQNKMSKIEFNIKQTTESWNRETNKITTHKHPKRIADVYVFCVLGTPDGFEDGLEPNPLDIDQWKFYVLAESKLGERKTITLGSLCKLVDKAVSYADLPDAIRSCAGV